MLGWVVTIFIIFIIPKHTDSVSLVISFLVELLIVSGDKAEDITRPAHSCLMMAIVGCMLSSVLRIISSSSITTFSLIMFTLIQGTWLIHTSLIHAMEILPSYTSPGMSWLHSSSWLWSVWLKSCIVEHKWRCTRQWRVQTRQLQFLTDMMLFIQILQL